MKKMRTVVLMACGLALGACVQAAPEKTIENLNTAFRGESNASARYEAFAKKADQEGFTRVAKLFRAASKAEAIHRDTHKEAITRLGGKPAEFALEEIKPGSTKDNLQAALKGEIYERDVMYPGFLKLAREEQARPAIRSINFALAAETEHAKLYQEAIDTLDKKKEGAYYVCPVCGFTSTSPFEKNCPVCRTPKERLIAFK